MFSIMYNGDGRALEQKIICQVASTPEEADLAPVLRGSCSVGRWRLAGRKTPTKALIPYLINSYCSKR